MKTIITLFLLFAGIISNAQIITTVIGNGIAANAGDGGPASVASINYPVGGVFDKNGNYYFTLGWNGHQVKKVRPDGIITAFAGTGAAGYSGDGGPATAAKFNNAVVAIFDSFGNMYISDCWNNRIRKIDVVTGIITTFAGTGTGGFSGDGGLATNAELNNPGHLCFDKYQNLYISDHLNYRMRKISPSGIITTVAGNGVPGLGANGVPATSTALNFAGIITDNTDNIYFADDHGRVFKISPSGILSYFIGDGTGLYAGDDGPASTASLRPNFLLMDKFGNIIIAESFSSRVRIVTLNGIIKTLAGNGIEAHGGDGGPATAASIDFPSGLALDSCGNLYIPDGHRWRIRKVTFPKCNYLNVNEQSVKKEVSIYPNPANDELNITSPGLSRGEVVLCNVLGQVVSMEQVNSEHITINIKHLPPGLYLLALTDEDGKRTVHKIVKE